MIAAHPLFRQEMAQIAAMDLPFAELRGKTVAVTGAGGLIGFYLMHALDEISRAHGLGLKLIALCRDPGKTGQTLAGVANLSCLRYDATAPITAQFSADYILHGASNAHPLAFSSDPVGTMQANILGTMNLLEHARSTGGKFILFSTGEIYGERPELEAGFDETTFGSVNPMNARACYPESKRAAETLCAAYAQQYGVNALAARLTYVYGPSITASNSRADAQFLRKALSGEDIVLKSEGVQVRSYCYAPDAASALIALMLRGEAAQAYNISNPDCAVSIRHYAETLARAAGVQVVFDLPPEQERRGYSAVSRAVLRADKLMALGWRASYGLEAGLNRTLKIIKGTID